MTPTPPRSTVASNWARLNGSTPVPESAPNSTALITLPADSLFVVDRRDKYLGTIPLTRLLTEDPEHHVGDCLDSEAPRIDPATRDVVMNEYLSELVKKDGRLYQKNIGVITGVKDMCKELKQGKCAN